MKYFSGFSLSNEESLFQDFIPQGEYTLAGFSYGAIKAFEYALESKNRIDRLILLSPAFFQDKKSNFKLKQLAYFRANKKAYIRQFLANVTYPSKININKYLKVGRKEELESLLNYQWKEENIKKLLDKGIRIEVFLGEDDKIIDSTKALEFFEALVSVYTIKNVGHLLQ